MMSADTERNGASESQDESEKLEVPVQYADGMTLALICFGLTLSVFCLGLDRSIMATAIPKITSEFNSLNDVAWYGSAYLLTTCCFQLLFGKLYAEYKVNWVFLVALSLFEIGSLICGCAPNSLALILGRAIQGIGCAGVMAGALTILALSVPLHKRPTYTGAIGSASGVAQIIAPTLGGVFTDRATWRWCFWINLPLGVVTAAVVIFFVKLPPQRKTAKLSPFEIIEKFDILGTVILVPSIICLLLALQWGGSEYGWENWRVILCLCFFGILFLIWIYIQHRKGDAGTLPLRILKQRSIAGALLYTLGGSGSLYVIIYYIPIWFQAVKNVSAQQSGINFLTSSGPMAVMAVLSGVLTSRFGYYMPQMYASSVIVSVSSGLIYRYNLQTTTGYWVGTLVMFGFGTGLGLQLPFTAAQTVLKGPDISIGTSVVLLAQTISGTIFLAVGQNLFQMKLVQGLASDAPGVDAAVVLDNGVSGLSTVIERMYGSEAVTGVLEAYNSGLQQCFLICIVLSCLTVLGAIPMEWKNVKQPEHPKEPDASTLEMDPPRLHTSESVGQFDSEVELMDHPEQRRSIRDQTYEPR